MRAGVPAGLGRCWAGRLGAGFGLYMTLTAKRQASGRKSSSFRPFSLRALLFPSSDVLAFLLALSVRSGRASWRHRGGVSIWPGCWACRALLRHGAGLAALVPCLLSVSPAGRAGAGAGHGRRSQAKRPANQQNAQRFNKKCSIMTKIMPCILCFLRCKYACFGVK